MKTGIAVKLQTGFFERTAHKLKTTTKRVTFSPNAKDGDKISIPAASIKVITFYEAKLKMEIEADDLTEAYFANADDWLDAMSALKENLSVKIICEMN